jgi:hypothetical protein
MLRRTRYYLIFLVFHYTLSLHAAIPVEERDVLIELYNSTGGKNWTSNSGWLGDFGTECDWSGISCLENHVVRLDLSNRGLTGSIPKILVLLAHLKELDLSNNMLGGTLPSIFGNDSGLSTTIGVASDEDQRLIRLEVMHLHNNQFSGSIPKNLGSIQVLTLHNNKFTGSIVRECTFLGNVSGDEICESIFSSFAGDILFGSSSPQRLTLFNNCLSIDFSKTPPDLSELQVLDLGNQNSCNEDSGNNTPIVLTFYNYDIDIPSIVINEQVYGVELVRYNPSDTNGWYWRVNNIYQVNKLSEQVNQPLAIYSSETLEIKFNKIYLGSKIIEATLYPYVNPSDPEGFYFQYIP